MFKDWSWEEFIRALWGGLLSGFVGGVIYEYYVPSAGVLFSAFVGAIIGAVGAVIVYVVDKV